MAATWSGRTRSRTGDTLVGIANKFGVSMMSVWWANDLKSKQVKAGKTLRIPPVTGLIVTVAATDTLDGLAAKYKVNSTDILVTNGLDDRNLVVGQVLVVPGAKGKAIPKPTSKPAQRPVVRSGGGGGTSVRPPATYGGGNFTWPVVGGDNYVSQYYHYGHYALDIAADYGSTVRAAAAGTVVFAGWKSNGGGYQVWIGHGSGLYTTYNHMSAISVGRGEHVGPWRARRARRPVRPCQWSAPRISKSGVGRFGMVAGASTRWATSRRFSEPRIVAPRRCRRRRRPSTGVSAPQGA